MDEQKELKDTIREVIRTYRIERGYFGGTGLADHDETTLANRLADTVSGRLEAIERDRVTRLRNEIEELEEELRLAKGSGYGELRQEYEAAKALAKHLIYRLGKEDDTVVLSVDDLQEMEQRVTMQIEEEDGRIMIRTQEYE